MLLRRKYDLWLADEELELPMKCVLRVGEYMHLYKKDARGEHFGHIIYAGMPGDFSLVVSEKRKEKYGDVVDDMRATLNYSHHTKDVVFDDVTLEDITANPLFIEFTLRLTEDIDLE